MPERKPRLFLVKEGKDQDNSEREQSAPALNHEQACINSAKIHVRQMTSDLEDKSFLDEVIGRELVENNVAQYYVKLVDAITKISSSLLLRMMNARKEGLEFIDICLIDNYERPLIDLIGKNETLIPICEVSSEIFDYLEKHALQPIYLYEPFRIAIPVNELNAERGSYPFFSGRKRVLNTQAILIRGWLF